MKLSWFKRREKPRINWEELHPKVRQLAEERFRNGFYADAVSSTLVDINSIVKREVIRINGNEYDGVNLMRQAFSFRYNNGTLERNALILFVEDLSTQTRRNIQEGYSNIFIGAISGIRNPKAHENLNPDELKTRHLLQLSSLLFIKLEEAGLDLNL